MLADRYEAPVPVAAPAQAHAPPLKVWRTIACFALLMLGSGLHNLKAGWNTFKEQMKAAWREQP